MKIHFFHLNQFIYVYICVSCQISLESNFLKNKSKFFKKTLHCFLVSKNLIIITLILPFGLNWVYNEPLHENEILRYGWKKIVKKPKLNNFFRPFYWKCSQKSNSGMKNIYINWFKWKKWIFILGVKNWISEVYSVKFKYLRQFWRYASITNSSKIARFRDTK